MDRDQGKMDGNKIKMNWNKGKMDQKVVFEFSHQKL